MKKIILSLALVLIVTFGLVACAPKSVEKTSTAYGLVHGHYVGQAVVTAKDDKVVSIKFDEMQMPYNWAQASAKKIGGVDIADDDLSAIGNKFYAKKIKIGDEVLDQTAAATASYPVYKNSKINDIEKFVKTDANGKWYFDQMSEGKYEVLKADGTAYTIPFTKVKDETKGIKEDLTKKTIWLKSKNGYWFNADAKKGWGGNMKAMETYFVGKNLNTFGKIEQNADKVWTIGGDVVTGATLTDFADYLNVAILAFNK